MSPAGRPRPTSEAGFSLTELLVASLLMILITTALFTSLEQTEVMYEDYSADIDLRQSARVALSQMDFELRMIGYDLGSVDEAITIASDTQVQFVGDIDDGDAAGACDANSENADGGGAERITYTFDGAAGSLRRQVDCWNGVSWSLNAQDSIVLTGLAVESFLFRFYDDTGTRIPFGGGTLDEDGRTDVRAVAIDIGLSDEEAENLLGEGRTDLRLSQHVKLQNRTYDD